MSVRFFFPLSDIIHFPEGGRLLRFDQFYSVTRSYVSMRAIFHSYICFFRGMASLGGLLLSKVTLCDIVKFVCVNAFMHKRPIHCID